VQVDQLREQLPRGFVVARLVVADGRGCLCGACDEAPYVFGKFVGLGGKLSLR
jgi:hypothetical protein